MSILWFSLTTSSGTPVRVNMNLVRAIKLDYQSKKGCILQFGPTDGDYIAVQETMDEVYSRIAAAGKSF